MSNAVLAEIRTDWDNGDRWGSAMLAAFDIADALYWLDPDAVPASWQYRPAAGGIDFTDDDYSRARDLLIALGVDLSNPYGNDVGYAAEAELIAAGNVLGRLRDIYRSAGLDY